MNNIIEKRKLYGHTSIRHSLNEDLKVMGGHIGYDTRPSFRGKLITSQMLAQNLPIVKKLEFFSKYWMEL